ncbi:MAG: ACT domain-containing protein [Ruminococcaceae bacterium]|nr:ACT domain-containing protein [Oscillospiraceae bacterium]
MKAIVTVIGKDRSGIIAAVCTLLAENKINILDISQTVMEGFFTMTMLIDMKECVVPFAEVSERLNAKGEEMNLSIRIQREDIFDKMHRV